MRRWWPAWRWLILAGYATALTAALLVEDPLAWFRGPRGAEEALRRAGDKTLHAAAYAGLGFLLSAATGGRHPLLAALAAAAHGAATEFAQAFVPHRSADFWDWNADVGGACCGILAHLLLFPPRR